MQTSRVNEGYNPNNFFATFFKSDGSLEIRVLKTEDYPRHRRTNIHGKSMEILTDILKYSQPGKSIQSEIAVDQVARNILAGYENKMGFLGRLLDNFLGLFIVTERQKIHHLVQQIIGLTPPNKSLRDVYREESAYLGKCINELEAQVKPKAVNTLESEIVIPENPQSVHAYPGNLTNDQKLQLKAEFIDDSNLKISFNNDLNKDPKVVSDQPDFNFAIRRTDLFASKAKVIVNAANAHLQGGGGIDGQVCTRGGTAYTDGQYGLGKTKYNYQYPSGFAEILGSGDLKEKYGIDHVIVVAGPTGSPSPVTMSELYSCYYNSLVLAHQQGITSIAFPSIATGIFGFDKKCAADVSLRAVHDFVSKYNKTQLRTISIHFYHTEPKSCLETYKTAAQGL